jgi:bifunctional UDP-N-acetylglucosamine pyrophosphorylase/glucosamine-1-phosphate N-acetyltransferase
MKIAGVVLAAGIGKRMNSYLPKVLHTLHGATMLQYVLKTLNEIKPQKIIVVVGKHVNEIKKSIESVKTISFMKQKEPKGTGDALLKAVPFLKGFKGTFIVVNGDTPLITSKTLINFLALHREKRNVISLLSFMSQHPGSYGRVIRDERGDVISIIEDRDATLSQKKVREVNSGVYVMEPGALPLLREIKLNVSKGEYYLTDIIHIARDKGVRVGAYCIGSENEFMGINTQEELEKSRQLMKDRIIRRWVKTGVNFSDTTSVFISSDVEIGKGTTIYPNIHLEGDTKIGKGCTIYPNVRIRNSILGDGVVIKDSTLIEDSVVKNNASVGPFAHLRPGSEIGSGAKIGNFVEVKKSLVGSRTKAAHLTYIGDAKIGKAVNIGAGTITCNYDGYKKQVTTIEDNVFVGSDSQFIAPVKIGRGAYVAAGSTITRDVPPNALALSRMQQMNIKNWVVKRKLKYKSAEMKNKKKRKR